MGVIAVTRREYVIGTASAVTAVLVMVWGSRPSGGSITALITWAAVGILCSSIQGYVLSKVWRGRDKK